MTSERIVSLTKELGIPDADDINEVVRRSVLALSEGQGIRKEDLALVLGVSRTTAFNKLSGKNPTPFTFAEIAQLAAFFEVPITDFQDGLGGRIRLAQRKGDRIVRLPVTGATPTGLDSEPTVTYPHVDVEEAA
jgi:transcriptional regulator with XRE-family HTH domain